MRAVLSSVPALFLMLAVSLPLGSANTEALLSELNRKPAEERLKALIDGARKERVLSFYGSAPLSTAQDVLKAFNARYPFVEVRYTRLGAPALVRRVITESQGGLNQ